MEIFENKTVQIIKSAAGKFGARAFIVGGAARDILLGAPVIDIDFLIEANAIDFVKKAGFKIKSIHEDFGTVKAEIEGNTVDIASSRCESYPVSGGLPVVDKIGVSIENDLKRRDFTINSIAIDISTRETIDPFGGKQDIKNGVLRVLHNNSFIDDPTRILRGIDFKHRFNFDFDPETKTLIEKTVRNYDRAGLSIDRIYLTLNKIFSSKTAAKTLKEILQNEIYKIWTYKTELKPDMVDALEKAAEIFNVKNKSALYIMALDSTPYIKAPLADNFEIFNFFKKFKPAQLALYYFKTKDKAALTYLDIKDISPVLTGKILIEAGYKQGEIIGQILNAVTKQKVLNPDKLTSCEEELEFVFKEFPILK